MLRNKTFAPEFCSLISNWFDMKEQAPGSNLLNDSVSWASSLVCTEICFAGACLRSKLPRMYWNLLCGSVFHEKAPSCVLVGVLTRERFSRACLSSFVCTGWSTYPEACFGRVFQEQAPSCVPAFTVSGMQIMTAKTTALRTLYGHVVLNGAISRQMLYDIVPYAWHFLPVKFSQVSRVCHWCFFKKKKKKKKSFPKYYFNKLCFQLPRNADEWINSARD